MKCAIVLIDRVKQIMFAPENDNERQALIMITPNDDITLETKRGSFRDSEDDAVGYNVTRCQGGYLRAFEQPDCLMLVLTPKKGV